MLNIKLRYGLEKYKDWTRKQVDGEVEWFDSAEDAIEAHQKCEYPECTIYVYGLGARLTSIRYMRVGPARGYHDFGIHPDVQELCESNGITNEMIWGSCFE